jgi:hypothetical protein
MLYTLSKNNNYVEYENHLILLEFSTGEFYLFSDKAAELIKKIIQKSNANNDNIDDESLREDGDFDESLISEIISFLLEERLIYNA